MATPFRHSFKVEIEGVVLPPEVHSRIFRVEVDTTVGMASTFTLHFHDHKKELVDDAKFDPGKALKIKTKGMGQQAEEVIFDGEITSIEPFYTTGEDGIQFIVRGYDKTHRLTKGTKRRVFKQVKHSAIVQQILGEYGLSAETADTTTVYDHVFQDNMSDRDFIEGLARLNGYIFGYKNSKVQFKKPTGDATVTVKWGVEIKEFHPRINAVGLVDEVNVTGWDVVQKKEIVGVARSSSSQPTGVQDSNLGITKSKTFGAAKYHAYLPDVKDASSAGKIAQALLDNFNSGYVEVDGVAEGLTKLVAGTKLQISELGARFNGTYFITSARHVIEENQYFIYFSSEGAKAHLMSDMILGAAGGYRENGGGAMWHGVVPAIVTNINDTDGDMVRVKVKYPWLDTALESHWVRVASVGAGQKGAGIHWLPQINDEVLIAFENGNINRPYVIGGLWNGKDKPPQAIGETLRGGNVNIRTIKTPAGNIIKFYDASGEEKIEISDAKGKTTITLDGQGQTTGIKTSGDLTIKADGKILIEGMGVTVDSKAALDLLGTGASKLDIKAPLTIKGVTVAIN
jgi:phage protein D/phage baseplate assembly protein gpV